LYKFFQPDRAAGVSLSVELHTAEDVFICDIKNGEMTELGFGTLAAPDLVLTGATATFMGLIVGYLTVTAVLDANQLTIEKGEVETVINFFNLFEGEHSAVTD
jgi:putative sterol carrier protein